MSACPLPCGFKWNANDFNHNCLACLFELGRRMRDEEVGEYQPDLTVAWKNRLAKDEAYYARFNATWAKLQAAEAKLQAAEVTEAKLQETEAKLQAAEAKLNKRLIIITDNETPPLAATGAKLTKRSIIITDN